MTTEGLTPKDRIVVALDVADLGEARTLVDRLGDSVGVYKIGLELIYRGGLGFTEELLRKGHKVLLDAKLLDIEATVERATAAIADTGAQFLTVHATDRKTLDAAVRGRGDSAMKLLGVTVLTNLDRADLGEQGIDMPPLALVQERARLAQGVLSAPWRYVSPAAAHRQYPCPPGRRSSRSRRPPHPAAAAPCRTAGARVCRW